MESCQPIKRLKDKKKILTYLEKRVARKNKKMKRATIK
jgi:hypothetical protein